MLIKDPGSKEIKLAMLSPIEMRTCNLQWTLCDHYTGRHVQKPYSRLGTYSHNAYTKFFCWLLMHICILIAIRPKCLHPSVHI